ncbi:MAG: hypothetical protein HY343_03130 [Lentisphaerae bacterium]|nr:hypothetical protein [Lentisphaerota bacterium]
MALMTALGVHLLFAPCLRIRVQGPVPNIYQLYYDTGGGYSETESQQLNVAQDSGSINLTFALPWSSIRNIRFDPGIALGQVALSRIVLESGFSRYEWTGLALHDEMTALQDLDPLQLQKGIVVAQVKGPDPQFGLGLNIVHHRAARVVPRWRAILSGVMWLVVAVLAWTLREQVYRALLRAQGVLHYNTVSYALLFATALVLSMAVVAKPNVSPDENCHLACARFYSSYWLPPAIGDPRSVDTISGYGSSKLDNLSISHFFLGKASVLFHRFTADTVLGTRLVNVALLFALWMVALLGLTARRVMLVLMLSPQIWYVFSYANDDAFGVFLGLLVSCQLVGPGSALNRYLASEHIHSKIGLGIAVGVLVGIESLVKDNYLLVPLLVGFYFAWSMWFAEDRPRRIRLFWKASVVLGVAILILVSRAACNISINGWDHAEKRQAQAERLANDGCKPSQYGTDRAVAGIAMRSRGEHYSALFLDSRNWISLSFKSFTGLYGNMNLPSPKLYYALILAVYLALGLYVTRTIWRNGHARDRMLLVGAAGLCLLIVGLSTYSSWVNDFQPQGRYLFPLLPVLATVLGRTERLLNQRVVVGGCWLAFILSSYSFVLTGLLCIPK